MLKRFFEMAAGKSKAKGKATSSKPVEEVPSTSFNMRVLPIPGNKKKTPKKASPPNTRVTTASKKDSSTSSDSDSSSDEDIAPAKKLNLSTSAKSKASTPVLGTKTSGDSKTKPAIKQLSSTLSKLITSSSSGSSDSESEDEKKKTGKKEESGMGTGPKHSTPKPTLPSLSRKNLSSQLSKVKAKDSSDSDDSDDYESTVDEEDVAENGTPASKKVVKKKAPTSANAEDIDVLEGSKVVIAMSNDDIGTFLQNLESKCPILDSKSSNARANAIPWKDIAFGQWDADACRKAWLYLRRKRRSSRNMWEVVHEVKYRLDTTGSKFRQEMIENCPGYPAKIPGMLNGINLYAHEKYDEKKRKEGKVNYLTFYRDISKKYNSFPDEEKQKWVDKAQKLHDRYQADVQKFFDSVGYVPEKKKKKSKKSSKTNSGIPVKTFPDAPQPPKSSLETFIQSKLEKLTIPPQDSELEELREKYAKKWLGLEDSKKVKFIQKVIDNVQKYYNAVEEYKYIHEDFDIKNFKFTNLVPKAELELWERKKPYPRPVKPPATIQEFYRQELEENGELDTGLPENERKTRAMEQWKIIPWLEGQRIKLNMEEANYDYVNKMSMHFTSLPQFLKPMLITGIDKKHRSAVTGTDTFPSTPMKRKQDAIASTSSSVDAVTAKKKKKVEKIDVNEVIADVEKTKKKKKKSATLYEIIRGIFDGRQELGRRYSVYYYYARSVAGEEVWVTTLESLGIVHTAERILESFLLLNEREKITFINHSRNFHMERFHSLKVEPEDFIGSDEQLNDQMEFRGEPTLPPSTPAALYLTDMKTGSRSKNYKSWNNLPNETKNSYVKKLYKMSRRYVQDYENFINEMTPNDLIEYTVANLAKSNNSLLASDMSNPDFVHKDFIFPLPKHCLPDVEDNIETFSQRPSLRQPTCIDPEGIFDNAEFLASVTDRIESKESLQSDDDTDSDQSVHSEGHDNDNVMETIQKGLKTTRKAKRIKTRKEELYNLGPLDSLPFQQILSSKIRRKKKKGGK